MCTTSSCLCCAPREPGDDGRLAGSVLHCVGEVDGSGGGYWRAGQSVACLEMVRKGEEVEKGSAEEKLGKVGLLFGFTKRFLNIGAKGKGRDGAIERKVVFGLRDAFVKIEKGLQRSGLEIPLPKSEATEVPRCQCRQMRARKRHKRRRRKPRRLHWLKVRWRRPRI